MYETALQLFDELWKNEPIRLMGISGAKAQEDGTPEQMSLFGNEEREKRAQLDSAIDSIRDRFGNDVIHRGSLMKPDAPKVRSLNSEKENI